jgi:hypothetical protein
MKVDLTAYTLRVSADPADEKKPTVGSGHRQVAEPTVLCRLQRRGPIRQRNQWNLAPHGLMLIAEYAAFPGNIARAGDAVSDPLGRWRSE